MKQALTGNCLKEENKYIEDWNDPISKMIWIYNYFYFSSIIPRVFKISYRLFTHKFTATLPIWSSYSIFNVEESGTDVINKFQHSVAMIWRIKALWLNVESHVTIYNQSERLISR